MPKQCTGEKCSGSGDFEGEECPGSDDEMHHCTGCGDLSWEPKGMNCSKCEDYYCIFDWQNTFVFFDGCETVDWEGGVCRECFLGDSSLWCSDDRCACECKVSVVKARRNKG